MALEEVVENKDVEADRVSATRELRVRGEGDVGGFLDRVVVVAHGVEYLPDIETRPQESRPGPERPLPEIDLRKLSPPHSLSEKTVSELVARAPELTREPKARTPVSGGRGDGATAAQPAATGFERTPIPSTSTSTTSPGRSETRGSRAQPTPAGVPVRIRSPGSSVKTADANATR